MISPSPFKTESDAVADLVQVSASLQATGWKSDVWQNGSGGWSWRLRKSWLDLEPHGNGQYRATLSVHGDVKVLHSRDPAKLVNEICQQATSYANALMDAVKQVMT